MSDTTNETNHQEESSVVGGGVPKEDGKHKVDPGFKRNIMIVGGAIGAAVLAIVFIFISSSSDKNKNKANVDVSLNQTSRSNGETELSPAMRESIRKKLEMEQKDAAANGQSVYMPKEILNTTKPINAAEDAAKAAALTGQPQAVVQPIAAYVPTPEELDKLSRRRTGLERQLTQLVSIAEAGKISPTRINFTPSKETLAAAAAAAVGIGSANAAGSSTQAALVAKPFVQALEIVPAEVASAIDSYKTNYASARIVAGKLAGAFLIGAITQYEDGLQIQYKQMRLGNQYYAIDAISLDEKTSTNAMDGNVDRRYLQRWVIPVLTAGIGGFASANSKPGSLVVPDGIGNLVSTPAATTEQARSAGIASGMSILQREVDKEAAKPYQIKLDANTPIGILFRAPVAFIAQ